MNYFAHGYAFLDRPYFLCGTAVPDWLNVVDRKMRAKAKRALPFVDNRDSRIAEVAAGIVQHHRDDAWFHQTRAFAELSLQFTVATRDALGDDGGFRPSFLGHVLVEVLLDATLIDRYPERLDRYYEVLNGTDSEAVASAVNRMATRTSDVLGEFIRRFCSVRFLYDYCNDEKLLSRLNMVMRRVRLPVLPDRYIEVLEFARQAVTDRQSELLEPEAGASSP